MKPCDDVGDEHDDDDEIEEDLLCSSCLSLIGWLILFLLWFFSAISASDQIPQRFFLSRISFSWNFLLEFISSLNKIK